MGKQSRKRQRQSGPRNQSSELLQRADASPSPSRDPEVALIPSPTVRDEIDESLSKIYESFFQEFTKRIPERQACPDPLEARAPQRSILDKKVRDKLIDRVRTLTHAIGSQDVYELFQNKTSDFICKLLEAVKSTEEERLALGLLEDAYDIMENAIEVVEGLIQLHVGDSPQMIMHNGKSEFYDLVLQDEQLKELLERGSLMEPQREQLIYEMLEQGEELNEEESEFQRKVAQQETIQKMSIEELVTFINEPPKQARRDKNGTSGTSTADGSKSPDRLDADYEADLEVERFREKLERCSPVRRKIKPRLSEEWLRRLGIPSQG